MRHQLLPSGRVRYYPLCDYRGDGNFVHKLTGEAFHVDPHKTVDCTFLKTTVPATHTPNFDVADGVNFIPLNDLPKLETAPEGYVVVGGGKTGIDAVLWLLEQRVGPENITWIKSSRRMASESKEHSTSCRVLRVHHRCSGQSIRVNRRRDVGHRHV